MSTISKFLFDTQFDEDRTGDRVKGDEPTEDDEPEAQFTEQDLQAAREQGYAEGLAAAQEQAQNSLERQIVLALASVDDGLRALMADGDQARQARLEDVVALAGSIARKVAGDALSEAPDAVIAALAHDCVDQLYGQTSISMKVPPALLEALTMRLAPITASMAGTGRFEIVGDASLTGTDCRLEWSSGRAERHDQGLWAAMEDTINRFDLTRRLDPVETNDRTAPTATAEADQSDRTAPPDTRPPDIDGAADTSEMPPSPEVTATDDSVEDSTLADVLGPEIAAARAAAATPEEPADEPIIATDAPDDAADGPQDTGASDGRND